MKLTICQDSQYIEPEILLNYSIMDESLEKLIRIIRQSTYTIQAKIENTRYFVPAEDVYYIDTADGKTFLYTKDQVFQGFESLIQLEKKLISSTFVRISKNCILNVSYLNSVSPLWNHRLTAHLSNGERIIVTRHYLKNLKGKIINQEDLS